MAESRSPAPWLLRPVPTLVVIGALIAALQIPISLVRGVIQDRVATRSHALADVTTTWGGPQSIIGPRLVVPFRHRTGSGPTTGSLRWASFLPAELSVRGTVTAQVLTRGLFSIPVYQTELRLSGHFEQPDVAALGLTPDDMLWDEASLVVEVTDPKSIGSASRVTWRTRPVDLLPGTRGAGADRRGIHALVGAPDAVEADFDLTLQLMGSTALRVVPFSRDTRVEVTSNWDHPSFAGAWSPTRRELDGAGFTAEWDVPFLGRDYPQAWTDATDPYAQILASRFGVDLISPIDHYRMSERSTKYAPLFLVLTFGLLWLFDTLVGIRVHPVQYLLVGAAMCLFYLLELSLSEHIGFLAAYAIASGSVVGLVGAYTKAVLHSSRRGARMAAALGTLYAYLLALLTLERYALLAGSVGLFVALGAVMYLTRWVDWTRVSRTEEGATT